MVRLSRIWFPLFCTLIFFSIGAWGQGSPMVDVSDGVGNILNVNTSTGAVTTLVSNEGAAYEGLVVGPDNPDNPTHPFLLYACDPTHNKIIRFDPNNVEAGIETVYTGTEAPGTLQQPQCARITNTGDLIVSSKVPGSGIWEIAGVANIALGAGGFPTPVQNPPNGALSATQVSQGIAQKNIGDLLIVDNFNGKVIRSPFGSAPHFDGTLTVFISGLSSPFGIARKSNGEIYVSNQGASPGVSHFNADGTPANTCPSVSFDLTSFGEGASLSSLSFMQMTPDDTLYIAASVSEVDFNVGAVFSVNAADNSCPSAEPILEGSVPPFLNPLVGIALPLVQTSVSQQATFSGNHIFNFGFAAVAVSGAQGPSCNLTVKATPTTPAALASLIPGGSFPFGATTAVNLAWDGFEIAFDTTAVDESQCASSSDGLFHFNIAAQLDTGTAVNPQIVSCDDSCILVTTTGVYPRGVLPSDGTVGGSKVRLCHVFLVNANPNTSEPGNFCRYAPPLINTQDPGKAPTFSSASTLPVKSLLAAKSGTCRLGPYITDATALLSVAQIADANGNPVFNPFISPSPLISPLDGNYYHLNLILASCCAAPGTYMLTTDFLTGNTSTLYTTQTVVFKTKSQ